MSGREYVERRSMWSLPPAARLLCAVATVTVAVLLPARAGAAHLGLLGVVLVVGLLRGVPPLTWLWRLLPLLALGVLALPLLFFAPVTADTGAWTLPLAGRPVNAEIAWRLGLLLGKAALVVAAVSVFAGGGFLRDLLEGSRQLRVPRPLRVMTYLGAYWTAELRRQGGRMHQAALARGGASSRGRARLALALGQTLMRRSLRRADTIAFALCARGFSGDLPVMADRGATGLGGAAAYSLVLTGILWLGYWR